MNSVVGWLLGAGDPSVRYRTRVELLGQPKDSPEVLAERAMIPAYSPVAALLDRQKPEGYWIHRNYYIPKHSSTFWVMSILAEMSMPGEDRHIRAGCEYLFTLQRPDGGFCREQRVPGKGWVWDEIPEPCTHARILRLLMLCGYREDPRVRQGMNWLIDGQRLDFMWLCKHGRGRGCLRATLDFLRAAVLDPETAALPATANAAKVVANLLMEPHMNRYHVPDEWLTLTYPAFGYSLIQALDVLARFGLTVEHPRIAKSVEYLLSRRFPDGTWPLDEHPKLVPLPFGEPGHSNPWITLEALVALKRLGVEMKRAPGTRHPATV